MTEISEDGFWEMAEGEWTPTEKQLEALQNGAIGHDGETVQQEIGEAESPKPFVHRFSPQVVPATIGGGMTIMQAGIGRPVNMMSFQDSIISVLTKYIRFEGRASRSEYWWFFLATIIVSIPLGLVDGLLFGWGYSDPTVFSWLFDLAIFLPTLAVSIRRVHDTGRSGWYTLIPFYNLYLFIIEGEVVPNIYGPVPNNVRKDDISTQPAIVQGQIAPIPEQYLVISSSKDASGKKAMIITAGIVIGVVLLTVVLSGVLYVWASSLAASNTQDSNLVGDWTNPYDKLELQSDGNAKESTGAFESWYNVGENLYFEDEEYSYKYRYSLVDDILFLAPYDGDGVLSEEDCTAYLQGSNGESESHFNDRIEQAQSNGKFPNWCNP
jgi:uncharacterized membrane protein YhaH (DUF805 family)